jgi:ATP-dependent helicase HrpB
VRLASAIEPDWLIDLFADRVVERSVAVYDPRLDAVDAKETIEWEGLVLHSNDRPGGAPAESARVLAQAAIEAGPRAFAPDGALDRWLARARFAASLDASIEPPTEDALRGILRRLCEGRLTFAELRRAGLLDAVRAASGRASEVDRLAPESVKLAGGRPVAVGYEPGKPPHLASRLQDFFGMHEGPRVGLGRVPLVLELLAPNGRAVQVTTDLAGFWHRHYPAIRAELMRRYPRHSWPDDPTKPAPRMRPR